MAAKPVARRRIRGRVVTFVKPQLMHHEALALIDNVRTNLAGNPDEPENVTVRIALDELVRATNAYVTAAS